MPSRRTVASVLTGGVGFTALVFVRRWNGEILEYEKARARLAADAAVQRRAYSSYYDACGRLFEIVNAVPKRERDQDARRRSRAENPTIFAEFDAADDEMLRLTGDAREQPRLFP
jgi:hypothetical protein